MRKLRLVPSTHVRRPRSWTERMLADLWRRVRRRPLPQCGICSEPARVNHAVSILCGGEGHPRPIVVLMEAHSCKRHEALAKNQMHQYVQMLVVTYTDAQPIGAYQ